MRKKLLLFMLTMIMGIVRGSAGNSLPDVTINKTLSIGQSFTCTPYQDAKLAFNYLCGWSTSSTGSYVTDGIVNDKKIFEVTSVKHESSNANGKISYFTYTVKALEGGEHEIKMSVHYKMKLGADSYYTESSFWVKYKVTVTPRYVTSITLNETSAKLNLNQTLQLTATVKPTNATNKTVNWSSSDASVATVSSSGLVTAKGVGTCVIKVKAADGSNKSATCEITVMPNYVSQINISQTSATLLAGETLQLTAAVLPNNATYKTITWITTDAQVATVSNTGLVRAVGNGICDIIAAASDGSDVSAACNVLVEPSTPTAVRQTEIIRTDNGQVYDVEGRKTGVSIPRRGIIIKNGKKVAIK